MENIMNEMMKSKLTLLREFQTLYPQSYVGGSIGLMLRGIKLDRDMTYSDLDMIACEFSVDDYIKGNFVKGSGSASDFEYSFKYNHDDGRYTKLDVRINKILTTSHYDEINFGGKTYRVGKVDDILVWKKKYADKGIEKHIEDLKFIDEHSHGIKSNYEPTPLSIEDRLMSLINESDAEIILSMVNKHRDKNAVKTKINDYLEKFLNGAVITIHYVDGNKRKLVYTNMGGTEISYKELEKTIVFDSKSFEVLDDIGGNIPTAELMTLVIEQARSVFLLDIKEWRHE